MGLGRTFISATLAFSLVACGGGGGTSGGGNTGGGSGSGGGGTSDTCSLASRQDWALGQLDEWYLFPSLLDKSVNGAGYNSLQAYIDAVVAPARAQNRDRYFTYITSIEEENDLINNGSNAGFGVRLSYDVAAGRVFVVEAFENAPAFAEGIDRGSEILAVNGQSVSGLMASGGAQAVVNALGPSDPGVTRTLTIKQPDGSQSDISVTKADYALDPISNRYGAKILDNGGTKVGYLNLRTFIIDSAKQQLRQAFSSFRAQGVTHVILDLRYNGGGLVSVAEVLGDLLAADKTGQVFSRTQFRDSQSAYNEVRNFTAETQAIAATKIAVIGTEGTASASELVTNAFIPYLGANIALVGTDTYGKPVGQIARDRSACDDRLRVVAFRTVNSDGGGDYYSGLAGVMPRTCRSADDILKPLGDPQEASISTALDFLAGRSCTAIGAVPGSTAATGTAPTKRELMMPEAPSPAQLEIPGLQ
ncbi:S41 family peptidase [Qipengyuania mesophila]|uniref:S41 family peptidase n=1 Tax=Qipengyuania mesophila TaxID=2867246 RepID=UPI003514A7BA